MTAPDAQTLQQLGPWGLLVIMLLKDFRSWARSLRSQGARIGRCEKDIRTLAAKAGVPLERGEGGE